MRGGGLRAVPEPWAGPRARGPATSDVAYDLQFLRSCYIQLRSDIRRPNRMTQPMTAMVLTCFFLKSQ